MAEQKNYTLGRGKLSFSRFRTGTQNPAGFLYIGNSPEFNLTIESEVLDHFSSDEGIREKDDSIPLQVNRTGTFSTDNINPQNVALFFFGDNSVVTTIAAASLTETITDVHLGMQYKLGQTANNPTGYFGLDATAITISATGGAPVKATGTVTFSGTGAADDTITVAGVAYVMKAVPASAHQVDIGVDAATSAANLSAAINAGAGSGSAYGAGTVANPSVTATVAGAVVTVHAKTAGTAGNAITLAKSGTDIAVSGAVLSGGTGSSFVVGDDYTVNADFGTITILEGGAIVEGDDIDVAFAVKGSTRDRVISGTTSVEGALMYEATNPKGPKYNYYMPYVKISPNGDYALKGDEWQVIPFTLDIQKPASGGAAILVDGLPKYA